MIVVQNNVSIMPEFAFWSSMLKSHSLPLACWLHREPRVTTWLVQLLSIGSQCCQEQVAFLKESPLKSVQVSGKLFPIPGLFGFPTVSVRHYNICAWAEEMEVRLNILAYLSQMLSQLVWQLVLWWSFHYSPWTLAKFSDLLMTLQKTQESKCFQQKAFTCHEIHILTRNLQFLADCDWFS